MLSVPVTSVRPGAYIRLESGLFEIVEYQHVKPGKGGAFVRLKLKNMENGTVLEKTVNSDSKVNQVEVTEHSAQFLYRGGDNFIFMNLENYEQIEISKQNLEGQAGYLKPDVEVKMLHCEGAMIGMTLPTTVDLKIVETPPGVKGDTVSRGTKPATMETGIVVQVPLFIAAGETVRLDTRTGEYVERVS